MAKTLLEEPAVPLEKGGEEDVYERGVSGLRKETQSVQRLRQREDFSQPSYLEESGIETSILGSPGVFGESEAERESRYNKIHNKYRPTYLEPTIVPDEFSSVTIPNAGEEVKAEQEQGLDVSVVDFLFGGEMAVTGFKYDSAGLHHDWDIAKQQWSEEPLWLNLLHTTSLVGSMLFPAARAAWAFGKVGKGASLLKRAAGISKLDEIDKFKAIGLVDDSVKDLTEKELMNFRKLERSKTHYEDLGKKLEKYEKGETEDFTLADKVKLSFAKRFTNNYFKNTSAIADGEMSVLNKFHENLDSLFKQENLGRFFEELPDEAAGQKIFAHWLNKQRPGIVKGAASLTAQERKWADALEGAMRAHQQEALEAGLITPETIQKVGELHIPALLKDTPRPDFSVSRKYVPLGSKDGDTFLRAFDMPRLDSATLRARKKDLPEVAERLMKGELITDPNDLTVRGLVMDRLLLNNYRAVTDIATNREFAFSAHDVMLKFGSVSKAEKAGFVSLETLDDGIKATLRRMIKKKAPDYLDEAGELPMIKKSAFEDLFGEAGVFAQSQMSATIFDLLTAIHKTSKTALSPVTHGQNLASNLTMLMQAGFNPLSPRNLNLQSRMAKAFEKIAKGERLRKEAGRGKTGIENLGINLGKIDIDGKVFDLNKEIFDPNVLKLIEESAFESVEGFANVGNITDRLRKEQTMARAIGKGFLKAKTKLQLGDKEGFRWFDQATKWYLAEDMVPKMSYYMSLRAKGFTKDAAILEVGRRLPMYQTVGSTIKSGRKVIFPWLTFPTEAVRITKNNLMDHPLRMMPWLQMPSIIQSTLTATGLAPGAEDVKELKRQLPMWAQKNDTIIAGENSGAIGSGITGALVGGVAGGRMGGAAGALLGGAAGAAAGVGFGLSMKTDDERMRGTVLDWLPHSAFMLGSTSPEFGGDTLPFKDIGGALEQIPAQPFAIIKPLIEIMEGRTTWGSDIGIETTGDYFTKGLAGYVGFLSPPFIQKYGLKTTTPDVSASKYLTGTDVPGDITNISRLLTDSSVAIDPITGRPGNISTDLFLKNFGMWKSWATDPATRLANEQTTDRHLQKIRSTVSKNLAFALENGEDAEAKRLLTVVMSTFTKQHADNPRRAQVEFGKWLERRGKAIGKHPRLRGWSEEELLERLREVSKQSADNRGVGRREMIKFLQQQVTLRQMKRAKKETLFTKKSVKELLTEDF